MKEVIFRSAHTKSFFKGRYQIGALYKLDDEEFDRARRLVNNKKFNTRHVIMEMQ